MHSFVEYWAEKDPNRVAIDFLTALEPTPVSTKLTYGELNARANILAHHLLSYSLPTESIVPLCFPKSPGMYVALLGVLKAGYAYLPLEPRSPVERRRFAVEDAGAKCVLTLKEYASVFEGTETEVIFLDAFEWQVDEQLEQNPNIKITQSNLAYVLYTSGTTGTPKGVMIEHGNVIANLAALEKLYTWDSSSRMSQFAAYSFDVSVFEMFFGFRCGVVVCPADMETIDFGDVVRAQNLTILDLTTTTIGLLPRVDVPSVKCVIQTGEALTRRIKEEWGGNGICLVDAYGPTETTNVCVVNVDVDGKTADGCIGHTLESCSLCVVGFDDGKIVPVGCIGELCVGGPQVGRGYLNREELTGKRFVDMPGMGRVYRTGDVVRMLADGQIIFMGRRDEQVKLNGLRIELGEISSVIGANAATIVAQRSDDGPKVLVSFLALGSGTECRALSVTEETKKVVADAFEEARKKLPRYMVPSAIIPVTQLPRGSAGKVDRKVLKGIYQELDVEYLTALGSSGSEGHESQDDIRAWTAMELKIRNLIVELTGLAPETITRTVSIFQLGLDSISAIKLSGRLKSKEGIALSMVDIMQHPSIDQMATIIDVRAGQTAAKEENANLSLIREQIQSFSEKMRDQVIARLGVPTDEIVAIYPCTPMQESMLAQTFRGEGSYLNHMVFALGGDVDEAKLCSAWMEVVRKYDVLRTTFVPVEGDDVGEELEYLFAQVVWKDVRVSWVVKNVEDDVEVSKNAPTLALIRVS